MNSACSRVSGPVRLKLNCWSGVVPTGPIIHIFHKSTSSLVKFDNFFIFSDDWRVTKNLNGPFLLKFDTHGYEVPILRGARKTLENTNVIIMEVYNFYITEHTLLFSEMCDYLSKLGFRCYDLAEPMLRLYDSSFWQVDLFFCRHDSPIFSYSQYI